jgi:hypothetical protein
VERIDEDLDLHAKKKKLLRLADAEFPTKVQKLSWHFSRVLLQIGASASSTYT